MPYYKIKKIKRFIQNYCKKEKTMIEFKRTERQKTNKKEGGYVSIKD